MIRPMNVDFENWPAFKEQIIPMPGGLAALQQRILQPRKDRHMFKRPLFWVPGPALAMVAILVVLGVKYQAEQAAMQMLVSSMGQISHTQAAMLGLTQPIVESGVQDHRLPNTKEVKFFWVQATFEMQDVS